MNKVEAHYTNIAPIEDRMKACKAAIESCLLYTFKTPPKVTSSYRLVQFGLDGWEITVEFGHPHREVAKTPTGEVHHIHDDGVIAYATIEKSTPADPFNIDTEPISTGQDWDDVVPEIMADIARERAIRECGTVRNNDPTPVGFQEVIN